MHRAFLLKVYPESICLMAGFSQKNGTRKNFPAHSNRRKAHRTLLRHCLPARGLPRGYQQLVQPLHLFLRQVLEENRMKLAHCGVEPSH